MAVSVGANRRDDENYRGAIVAVAVTFAAPLTAQMPPPNTFNFQPRGSTLTVDALGEFALETRGFA